MEGAGGKMVPSSPSSTRAPGLARRHRIIYRLGLFGLLRCHVHPWLSCFTVVHSKTLPVFLLAGQSNMEGHPNQAGEEYSTQNNGAPGLSLSTLLSILTSSNSNIRNDDDLRNVLTAEILKVGSSVADASIAAHEADLLLKIQSSYPSFFSDMLSPLNQVYCSWTVPPSTNLAQGRPVSSLDGCGDPFGPELASAFLLSKILQVEDNSTSSLSSSSSSSQEFAVVKVARGGTELYADWSPTAGRYWPNLVQRLTTPLNGSDHPSCATHDCQWQALVWFQGENDCFSADNAQSYYGNLTQFLASVRALMHAASPTAYPQARDIPVILVKLGGWPVYDLPYGPTVVAAQVRVAQEDAQVYTVETVDLSRFYHFEAAAMLIIGYRLAATLSPILCNTSSSPSSTLLGSFCGLSPTMAPSSVPSLEPTAMAGCAVSDQCGSSQQHQVWMHKVSLVLGSCQARCVWPPAVVVRKRLGWKCGACP